MKIVQQQDKNDCGMACALMIVNHYRHCELTLSEFKLRHHYQRNELSFYEIEKLLSGYQIQGESYFLENFADLLSLDFPILVDVKTAEGESHYLVLEKLVRNKIFVFDPNNSRGHELSRAALFAILNGNLMLFRVEPELLNQKVNRRKLTQKLVKDLLLRNWLNCLIINFLTLLTTLSLLFSNMFLKVILTNYLFFTPMMFFQVYGVFIGLIISWASLSLLTWWLKKLFAQQDENYYLHRLTTISTDFKRWIQVSGLDFVEEQLRKLVTFLRACTELFSTSLALVCFSIFIGYVMLIFSKTFFFGSCLLVLLMFGIKALKIKYFSLLNKEQQILNLKNQQVFQTIVKNYEVVLNKTDLRKYYLLKKEKNSKLIQAPGALLIFSAVEKIMMLGFYVFLFLVIDFHRVDIASFLIFANIILVYNSQLDHYFELFWLMKTNLPMLPNFTVEKLIYETTMIITFVNQVVAKHYQIVRKDQLTNLLVDYQPLSTFIETDQVYLTANALLEGELISNNLFNFGAQANLEIFKKMKIARYLEKYQLDLTKCVDDQLNNVQRQLLGLLSACFCVQKIVLIDAINISEYEEIKELMIANLEERFLIFVEN